MAVDNYGNERDYYTSLLQREAEASVALDGETHDVGPVTVGEKLSPSEQAAAFEEWNQNTDLWEIGYEDALNDLEAVAAVLGDLALEQEQNQVQRSRIRVQLSRPLTWAEKEWLETDVSDMHARRLNDNPENDASVTVTKNGNGEFTYIWVEADFGSRVAYDMIAAELEYNFVNVFPRAVRTDREYNGE